MDGPLVVRFLIETSIIIRGMILYLEINVQAVDTSYFVMALEFRGIHKLCCLKIGNFDPQTLSSFLLIKVYVVNRHYGYHPTTRPATRPRRHSLWTAS